MPLAQERPMAATAMPWRIASRREFCSKETFRQALDPATVCAIGGAGPAPEIYIEKENDVVPTVLGPLRVARPAAPRRLVSSTVQGQVGASVRVCRRVTARVTAAGNDQ